MRVWRVFGAEGGLTVFGADGEGFARRVGVEVGEMGHNYCSCRKHRISRITASYRLHSINKLKNYFCGLWTNPP
jgi:hypothetical protein